MRPAPLQPVKSWASVKSHPSYMGSINRRITVQAGPHINSRPHLKNNESKKGLGAELKWYNICLANVKS
jgi:hypothetical protein